MSEFEIVGRQCFPPEEMKATPNYRKAPWVDGEIDQSPSRPDFYRVEPLIRMSDAQSELAALREELELSERNRLAAERRYYEMATARDCIATNYNQLSYGATICKDKLGAAEQQNADLIELLDSAFFRLDTFIEAEREMPIPSMEVLRDAILRRCPTLKPAEDATSSVDCGECQNITDGCHGVCMKAEPTESGESEEDEQDAKTVFIRSNTKQGQNISMADMKARYEDKP